MTYAHPQHKRHGDGSRMSALPWVFAVSAATGVFAFLADRILKPWRAHRLADAAERRALAQLTSEQMQAAFLVMLGQDAIPAQGIKEVPGVGARLAAIEKNQLATGSEAAEGRRLAGQAAMKADRTAQAVDNVQRGVNAVRAELDTYNRVVARDIADIWAALRDLGVDRRKPEDE